MGAVHVHFAVANVVEPRPGKEGLAGGGIVRQGKGPARLERAAADEGLDDGKGAAAVVRERRLAAAAVVRGAALDREAVAAACRPGRHGAALRRVEQVVVALAGEVAAARGQGAVHVVVDVCRVGVVLGAERGRVAHLHVALGEGCHEAGEGGEGELHGGYVWM